MRANSSKILTHVTMLAAIGASLSACANSNGVLSTAGACAAFDAPATEIAGRTKNDQRWINGQIESGVGACQWQRPKPRNAAWDGPTHSVGGKTVPVPTPPKKRLRDRLRDLVAH